jgi:hypothetical protein
MDRVETLNKSLLRTSSSVFQSLKLYSIPDGGSARTDFMVLARATDGTTASWSIQVCCKRVTGGNVVLIEPNEGVIQARKDPGASGWNVQAAGNGENLEIKVKSDNTHQVDWQITGPITVFVPPV